MAAFRAITLQYESKQVSGQESEPSAFLSAVLQIHLLRNSELRTNKIQILQENKKYLQENCLVSKTSYQLQGHCSLDHCSFAQVINTSGVTVTMCSQYNYHNR